MIDLHIHSNASDGTDPPERHPRAGRRGRVLGGGAHRPRHPRRAGRAARPAASELGVELVGGCEVSCAFRGASAHVLVYFVEDERGPAARRAGPAARRPGASATAGWPTGWPSSASRITYDEVVAAGRPARTSVGRPHFAALLVDEGAAESIPDAFDRWLARAGRPTCPRPGSTPAEVAGAGPGVGRRCAVLAHPFTLGPRPRRAGPGGGELAGPGSPGIEAIYGRYPPDERGRWPTWPSATAWWPPAARTTTARSSRTCRSGTGRGDLRVPDDVLGAAGRPPALSQAAGHRPARRARRAARPAQRLVGMLGRAASVDQAARRTRPSPPAGPRHRATGHPGRRRAGPAQLRSGRSVATTHPGRRLAEQLARDPPSRRPRNPTPAAIAISARATPGRRPRRRARRDAALAAGHASRPPGRPPARRPRRWAARSSGGSVPPRWPRRSTAQRLPASERRRARRRRAEQEHASSPRPSRRPGAGGASAVDQPERRRSPAVGSMSAPPLSL